MQTDESIMKYETVLPEDFDGTFRFTNPTDQDFTGIWGRKEYIFPAQTTCPMILPEYSPLEIQHIRKKFAKDLAEREFFKDAGYKVMSGQEGTPGNRTMNSIHQAATYSIQELTPFIQKCLQPLPSARASVHESPRISLEDKLSKDQEGNLNTSAVKSEKDLENLAKGKE